MRRFVRLQSLMIILLALLCSEARLSVLNQAVVFRRDENWQLTATAANIRESLLFKKPCPSGEIWLRNLDIVLIPKSPILCADDVINLVFTRGIYGVFPMNAILNFSKLSSLQLG